MALPMINAPTYEMKLASNGNTIKYRPFLVKEEKILLLALQSEDEKQILNAIKQGRSGLFSKDKYSVLFSVRL